MPKSVFDDLFVLELANNHWGKVDRGLKIINDFSKVVAANKIHASIKLQFRDVDSFIHKDFRHRTDIRYIGKTLATQLAWSDLRLLTEAVRVGGMLTMVTPFDEVSVDKCVEFGVDILKIASSDIKDWTLLEKIASTGKPVIASSGGSSLKDVDNLVKFFADRGIQFALNHCVSLYPSEDNELELNQIDFLRARYPGLTIGLSTHEYHDWSSSVMMAYAKGARTFERHIDIDYEGVAVSSYCTLPEQADVWFKAFNKAKEMCGGDARRKRSAPDKEVQYLDALVRGAYAKRDLPAGHRLTYDDVYFAVPLQMGQISTREFMQGEVLKGSLKADEAIDLTYIHSSYSNNPDLIDLIAERGLAQETTEAALRLVSNG
jgi:N-acetylneuraminate synthase